MDLAYLQTLHLLPHSLPLLFSFSPLFTFSPLSLHCFTHQNQVICIQHLTHQTIAHILCNQVNHDCKNQRGQHGSLVHTNFHLKLCKQLCQTLTLVFAPSYKLITAVTITSGIYLSSSLHTPILFSGLCQMPSPGQWSTYIHVYNFCLSKYSSCNLLRMNSASIVPLPGIKRNCIWLTFPVHRNLLSSTFSIIFIACSSNFTPLLYLPCNSLFRGYKNKVNNFFWWSYF